VVPPLGKEWKPPLLIEKAASLWAHGLEGGGRIVVGEGTKSLEQRKHCSIYYFHLPIN
jgi:hypothetical protein